MAPRRLLTLCVCLAALAALAAGCGSDGGTTPPGDAGADVAAGDAAVTGDAPPGEDGGGPDAVPPGDAADAAAGDVGRCDTCGNTGVPLFRFGFAPGQPISAAPFPNDFYFEDDGTLAVAPLQDDPVLGGSAKADLLAAWTGHIDAREGFGSTSVIWFFADAAPDAATLAGAVRLVTLAGPEVGREVAAQVFWSDGASAVGVFPAWGDYLVPGSTYAAILTTAVRAAGGEPIVRPNAVDTLLSAAAPPDGALERLHERWAPLRDWLAGADIPPDDVLVATVFTTEEVVPYARAVFDAVADFTLAPPTLRVRWDEAAEDFVSAEVVEGAALDVYFGVPAAPFEFNPGVWEGNRDKAASLPEQDGPYTGGTGHFGIARVVNGSIETPVFNFEAGADGALVNRALRFEGGAPQADLRALVPFTLFLCDEHLADPANVPVAIFSHGGGATRVDAVGWANGNCRVGVATIALDMVFHGGRMKTVLLADEGLVVPTHEDEINAFSGLEVDDEGFVPDRIGDPGSAVAAVAPLFAIGAAADPLVIEANLLTIAADTATLLRYVREGDWSQVLAGLSFDPQRIFHESLSFGTSFHTPLVALEDGFAGVVGSVATGDVLSVNLLMAPVNATQAAAVLGAVLGLRTGASQLNTFSLGDPALSIHQWLHERGDPLPYAPFVLRHRPTAALPPVLHSCDSWDETLYSPAQITYAQAFGLPPYTHGAEWTIDATIPGAQTLTAQPAPAAPLSGNATFAGGTTTAAIFFRSEACHAQAHTAICADSFEHPYPPIRLLPDPNVKPSPVCALHAQLGSFLTSILDGGPAEIVPPEGTCEALYGP